MEFAVEKTERGWRRVERTVSSNIADIFKQYYVPSIKAQLEKQSLLWEWFKKNSDPPGDTYYTTIPHSLKPKKPATTYGELYNDLYGDKKD